MDLGEGVGGFLFCISWVDYIVLIPCCSMCIGRSMFRRFHSTSFMVCAQMSLFLYDSVWYICVRRNRIDVYLAIWLLFNISKIPFDLEWYLNTIVQMAILFAIATNALLAVTQKKTVSSTYDLQQGHNWISVMDSVQPEGQWLGYTPSFGAWRTFNSVDMAPSCRQSVSLSTSARRTCTLVLN